jgi:hypothetical protein
MERRDGVPQVLPDDETGGGRQRLDETGEGRQRTGRGAAQDRAAGRRASLAAVRFGLVSLYCYFTRGYLGNVQSGTGGVKRKI